MQCHMIDAIKDVIPYSLFLGIVVSLLSIPLGLPKLHVLLSGVVCFLVFTILFAIDWCDKIKEKRVKYIPY